MIVQLYKGNVEVEFREASHRYKVNGTYMPGVTSVLSILAKELEDWAAWMSAEAFKEAVMPFATSEQKMTKMALKKLSDEAKKAHRQKSQRGKDVGTIAHAWIQEETERNAVVEMPIYVKTILDEIAEQTDQENAKTSPDEAKLTALAEESDLVKNNFKAAENCLRNWRQWKEDYDVEIIKSEFIVHSKELGYCGTVDVVFRSKRDGKVYIGDYKTSEPKKIRNSKYMIVGHKPYPEHFVQVTGYDYAHHEEYGSNPDGYAVIYLPKEGDYQMFQRSKVDEDRQAWEHLFKAYQWIINIRKEKH